MRLFTRKHWRRVGNDMASRETCIISQELPFISIDVLLSFGSSAVNPVALTVGFTKIQEIPPSFSLAIQVPKMRKHKRNLDITPSSFGKADMSYPLHPFKLLLEIRFESGSSMKIHNLSSESLKALFGRGRGSLH